MSRNWQRRFALLLFLVVLLSGCFSVKDEEEKEEEVEANGPFQCELYLGPSRTIGIGIVAGRFFNAEDYVSMSVPIGYPNTHTDRFWQLDNYAFRAKETDHSLCVIGVAMMFNHKVDANVYYFYDDEEFTHVNDTLDRPHSNHNPMYHGIVDDKFIARGEEMYNQYSENSSWFDDRNITLFTENQLAHDIPVTDEELATNYICLSQAEIVDSHLPFAGKGLIAMRNFSANETVTVSPALALPRFDVAKLGIKSMLQNYCIATHRSGLCLVPIGPAGVINHSPDPNVVMEWFEFPTAPSSQLKEQLSLKTSDLLSQEYVQLFLGYRSLRPIARGEELTIDYGTKWANDWSDYLAHLVAYLERKLGHKGTGEELSLPLFRSFIHPPAGLFPAHWDLAEDDFDEISDAYEEVEDEGEEEGEEEGEGEGEEERRGYEL
jgi:hypothetical protein